MSCTTTSTIHADLSNFTVRRFVEDVVAHGWDVGEAVDHTPLEGDEFDWITSPRDKAIPIIDALDERRTFSGVWIKQQSGGSCALTFNWASNTVAVLWGADGPRISEWPRVPDLGWAMRSLSQILDAARLRAYQIEFFIDAP